MTTFVDLYFPPNLPIERDEVETAIEADLGAWVEVVGAGVGASGSNLDLALQPGCDLGVFLPKFVATLTRLGVPAETMVAISEPLERVTLRELSRRLHPHVTFGDPD
jgi:hypothetical protein